MYTLYIYIYIYVYIVYIYIYIYISKISIIDIERNLIILQHLVLHEHNK